MMKSKNIFANIITTSNPIPNITDAREMLMAIEEEFQEYISDLIGGLSSSQCDWHISNAIRSGWGGCVVSPPPYNGETHFWPVKWGEDEPVAYYIFSQIPHKTSGSWLASALGLHDSSLCIRLSLSVPKNFYNNCDIFHDLKFCWHDGVLYYPFSFDIKSLSAVYPFLHSGIDPFVDYRLNDYPLWPLENALKAIYAAHEIISGFVKSYHKNLEGN